MVVTAVALVPTAPDPSPMTRVLLGKIHVVLMVMVPAGRRIVAGVVLVLVPYTHGVSPDGQVKLAEPDIPRASITAEAGVEVIKPRAALILGPISVLWLGPLTAPASM